MVKENKMGTLFYLHNITYNMLYYFPMEPIKKLIGGGEMKNHTPTPWKVSDPPRITGPQKEGDRLIYHPETGEHIAETFQYRNNNYTDAETSIMNAEFIVTACNAFDLLYKALNDILSSNNLEEIKQYAKQGLFGVQNK